MERFVKGDIVVVPFPFSNLSANKKRPALVLADLSGQDIILCQITSQDSADPHTIAIVSTDLAAGELVHDGFIRPARLFTADKTIIIKRVGTLSKTKYDQVVEKITAIIQM